MASRRVPMSWWEVAEIVYERRQGLTWEQIGWRHGVSAHKAKREAALLCRLAGKEAMA